MLFFALYMYLPLRIEASRDNVRTLRDMEVFYFTHSTVPVTQSDSLLAMFLPQRDLQIVSGSEMANVHGQNGLETIPEWVYSL